MNPNRNPSLISIVRADYYTFLSILFVVILWVFYALFQILNPSIPINSLFTALGVSFVALIIGIWRIQMILALFNSGIKLSATITESWFFRGHGRINYAYTYRGHDYLSGNDLVPTGDAKRLRVGDRVTVIIDPDNPARAIIMDLFS